MTNEPTDQNRVRISIRIDPQVLAQADTVARDDHRTRTNLIEVALIDYMRKKKDEEKASPSPSR